MKTKVGIIGATGYAGVELLRLLLSHPQVEVAAISSVSFEGQNPSARYILPLSHAAMRSCTRCRIGDPEQCDVVFASLPHGPVGAAMRESCVQQGKVFIDLGADFRL